MLAANSLCIPRKIGSFVLGHSAKHRSQICDCTAHWLALRGNNDLKKLTLQLSSVSADRSLLLLSCVCFQALEIIIPAFSTVAGNLKLGKVSRQADQNLKI